jgi:DNA-binding response OmpR family regulator
MAGSETLLLVVPELRRRLDHARALESGGFRVLQAPTAGIALTRCEREHPGIVLTDVVLPAVHGVDIARALRVCDASLLIIGLLPGCFSDDVAAAAGIAFDRLLHEPIDPAILVQDVRDACEARAVGAHAHARVQTTRPPDPVVYAS